MSVSVSVLVCVVYEWVNDSTPKTIPKSQKVSTSLLFEQCKIELYILRIDGSENSCTQ